ncbi:hypothetical protein DOTSEDRAFT_73529 [Dothistroma septosporum NZE10]|uniref:Uncharacterized protein n=1 Tax=Dothistroma septosporum (strain NZE10 / CBS 128990) TaxID=675120 RepID=N1PMT0_DOTSN|nr:hypothetical protein DOTSEDRAFT_73529 [Dothistroma septosporum NZE10]
MTTELSDVCSVVEPESLISRASTPTLPFYCRETMRRPGKLSHSPDTAWLSSASRHITSVQRSGDLVGTEMYAAWLPARAFNRYVIDIAKRSAPLD